MFLAKIQGLVPPVRKILDLPLVVNTSRFEETGSNVLTLIKSSLKWLIHAVEEEHGILPCYTHTFPLPHFPFKSANISSLLKTCVYVWRRVYSLLLVPCSSWVESSLNKQNRLNCSLFFHRIDSFVVRLTLY